MRLALLALLVAVGALTFTIVRPQLTSDDVTQMLVDNEIIDDPAEAQDASTNPNDYPHYAARTFICVWRDGDARAQCRWAPRATYPDQDTCETVEWAAIDRLADRLKPLHVNGRVRCVEEYNI